MSRRSGGTRGGMQTSSCHTSIICPKCSKSAFSAEIGVIEIYKHFTKQGAIAHIKDMEGKWTRKKV